MKLDLNLMKSVHARDLAAAAEREFGEAGHVLRRRLLDALPLVHQQLPVEMLPDGLVVFVAAREGLPRSDGSFVNDLATIESYPRRGFTIEVRVDGYHVTPAVVPVEELPLGLGYSFVPSSGERWHIRDVVLRVFNPVVGRPSAFGVPLFTDLDEALDGYHRVKVQECSCPVLGEGWFDERRLLWRQRPEVQIRRSLEQHLRASLRDAVVDVEHVVDETKPVDIVVRWSFSNRLVLVECKWLGRSVSELDDSGARRVTDMSASDAVAGLRQLAQYLDLKRPRAPGMAVIGHLVVIDGRRKGVGRDPQEACAASYDDLLHYEYSDVSWPPELVSRPDLGRPRRMFCRPRSGVAISS